MNVKINHLWNRVKFCRHPCFEAWSDEKFCKDHELSISCLYLLTRIFSILSEVKLKECISIGPQIRGLIKDEYSDILIQGDGMSAWETFKCVVKEFLGNRSVKNYQDFVNKLL